MFWGQQVARVMVWGSFGQKLGLWVQKSLGLRCGMALASSLWVERCQKLGFGASKLLGLRVWNGFGQKLG